jgi:hypothetical protein
VQFAGPGLVDHTDTLNRLLNGDVSGVFPGQDAHRDGRPGLALLIAGGNPAAEDTVVNGEIKESELRQAVVGPCLGYYLLGG